jgi:hypothetical protein
VLLLDQTELLGIEFTLAVNVLDEHRLGAVLLGPNIYDAIISLPPTVVEI